MKKRTRLTYVPPKSSEIELLDDQVYFPLKGKFLIILTSNETLFIKKSYKLIIVGERSNDLSLFLNN